MNINGMNIKFAPSDKTETYQDKIDRILEVLGHPGAFTTDWSTVTDFLIPYHGGMDEAEYLKCAKYNEEKIAKLEEFVGFDVKETDELVNIAEKMSIE